MITKRFCGLILCLGVLSGCATLSEDECRTADWREIGYTDGSQGVRTSRLAEHRKACAKFGVRISLDDYNAGHAEGVRRFCHGSSGFANGRQGYDYQGICPTDLKSEFLAGYREGKEVHRLEQQVSQLHGRINSHKSRLKKLKKRIKAKEDKMLAEDVSASDRRSLYRDIEDLKEQLHHSDYDSEDAERKIYHLEHEIEDLLQDSQYR